MTPEKDLQTIFENILRRHSQSGLTPITQDIEVSMDGADPDMKQQFFVRPLARGELPEVGVVLTFPDGRFEYFASLIERSLGAYGRIMVAEMHLEATAESKEISSPEFLSGPKGVELSDKIGMAIAQAVANVFKISILHPIRVDIGPRERREELIAKGYRPRPGKADTLDRIYQPR